MQVATIMAFRARLKKLGYEKVSIKRAKFIDQEIYLVRAVDPLAAQPVERYMTVIDMYLWR